jgi:hypothetical protein
MRIVCLSPMVLFLVGHSPPAEAQSSGTALASQCATQAEQSAELRDNGKLRDAEELLISCARDACPKIVKDDCRKALADLRSQSPYLSVRLRDTAGNDVSGGEVTIDKKVVSQSDLTRGVLVDPGEHKVAAKHPTLGTAETLVVVARGDRLRTVPITLARSDAAPPKAPGKPSPSITPVTSGEKNRTAAYVVGATGLVIVGVGAALGAWGYAGYADLSRDCAPRCGDRGDAAKTRALAGDITIATGLGTLVVATILWFLAPERTRTAAAYQFPVE